MSPKGLFAELQRRSILRVASAYVVIAWLLLQVASILLPTFFAPAWIMQGLTLLLIAGFPIAVLLAWFFEITPTGVVLDKDTEDSVPGPIFYGRTFDFAIIGILVIAVCLFSYNEFVLEDRQVPLAPERRPA